MRRGGEARGVSEPKGILDVGGGGVLAEAVTAASVAVFSAVECISSAATAAAASVGSSKKPVVASLMSLVTITSKCATAASSDEDKEMAALDKLHHLERCV